MAIEPWFLPAVLTLLIWGTMSSFSKVALRTMPPLDLVVYYTGFAFLTALFVCLVAGRFQVTALGVGLSLLTGVVSAVGQFFGYRALRVGPMSSVVIVISVYPVVATLLAVVFLHEAFSWRQSLGVLLAMGAVYLLVEDDA